MNAVAIRVENLGKMYRIGLHEPYKALRNTLTNAMYAPFRAIRSTLHRQRSVVSNPSFNKFIWALKEVSFEIKRGEVIGVIGRNGAGKSTLLKILSRITEPTQGSADIYGRVGSLLEVGVGFHPELTGRENIYLNGAILGMKKIEIDRKFDEIVAFAEIEKFIDTPVKYYSSGMYVKLAFAVAAHLEPEILVVDEVLAVGDIAFQKKCLGKMGEVAKGGRTVLFVSHNMGIVRSLCGNAIWLDNGQLMKMGTMYEVVRDYEENHIKRLNNFSSIVERNPSDVNNSNFYLSRVEMLDTTGENTTAFKYNEKLALIVDLSGYPPTRSYNLEFRIYNELEQLVCVGSSAFHGILLNKNSKRIRMEIGPLVLTSGRYTISLSTVDSQGDTRYDNWDRCCAFDIVECSPFGFGHDMPTNREGVCILQQSFIEI